MKTQMKRLTGFQLKWIAVISMVLDHVGACIIRKSLVTYFPQVTMANRTEVMVLYYAGEVCDALGVVAFPIFCFLVAEGFAHTRDRRRYGLRMLLFAAAAEIPFNLVHNGTLLYPKLQNVLFTLAIGILTLYGCSLADARFAGKKAEIPVRGWIIALGMGLAFLVRGEYVFLGVLAICLFYALREHDRLRFLAFVPLVVPSFWSLLAAVPIYLYCGKRGRGSKYFFYVFYPAHFLVIYGICLWMGLTAFAAR